MLIYLCFKILKIVIFYPWWAFQISKVLSFKKNHDTIKVVVSVFKDLRHTLLVLYCLIHKERLKTQALTKMQNGKVFRNELRNVSECIVFPSILTKMHNWVRNCFFIPRIPQNCCIVVHYTKDLRHKH